MTQLQRILATLVCFCLAVASAHAAPPKVEPDEKSIMAKRMLGTWTANDALTKRLIGKTRAKVKTLNFKADDTVVKKVPAAVAEKLGRIYAAGIMTLNGKHEFPYVLISWGGSPYVVFFQPRGGDPMGDTESFYVMMAKGTYPTSDLLFVGGDFARESFMAFDRVIAQ